VSGENILALLQDENAMEPLTSTFAGQHEVDVDRTLFDESAARCSSLASTKLPLC